MDSIAQVLGLSVGELFSGEQILNCNRSSNMAYSSLHFCPLCGNMLLSTGEISASCCGIDLVSLKPQEPDENHMIHVERIEDELYVTVAHPMSKEHHIAFIVYRMDDRVEVAKLYAEGAAECRFFYRNKGTLLIICNKHGLFEKIL